MWFDRKFGKFDKFLCFHSVSQKICEIECSRTESKVVWQKFSVKSSQIDKKSSVALVSHKNGGNYYKSLYIANFHMKIILYNENY